MLLPLSGCADASWAWDRGAYQYVLVFEGGHDDGDSRQRSVGDAIERCALIMHVERFYHVPKRQARTLLLPSCRDGL